MSKGVFFYTDEFMHYDMGPQHPMQPIRLRRTHELLQRYGALASAEVVSPRFCSVEDLLTVHSAEFVHMVDRLSCGERVPYPGRYGFGTGDNPIFPEMWDAARLYTGASVAAAQAVNDGRCDVAMNISGGLHHAHRDRAAGFCVFNDCAVAARRLRERFERVAYVDTDVHHGDGVQEAFYEDPTVLTISLHETWQTLFPGTGSAHEIGTHEGTGYAINLPFWPHTTDDVWLRSWREVALPALRAFDPGAIVLQLGADAHYLDPLAHLCLTAQGWLHAVSDVKALGKPIVALGGGGYNQTTVPRMWALAYGVLFGADLPDATPPDFSWHERVPRLTDADVPEVEPDDYRYARDYAEQTIEEVRTLVFPHLGL